MHRAVWIYSYGDNSIMKKNITCEIRNILNDHLKVLCIMFEILM